MSMQPSLRYSCNHRLLNPVVLCDFIVQFLSLPTRLMHMDTRPNKQHQMKHPAIVSITEIHGIVERGKRTLRSEPK